MKNKKEFNNAFENIKRKISDSLYDVRQKIYAKTHKNPRKAKSIATRKRGDILFYAILVVFPLLQFSIFYIGANFNSFLLAFQEYNPLTDKYVLVGWKNFQTLWDLLCLKNSQLQNAFITSWVVYGLGLLKLPLNLFVPYYIYKKQFGSEFFKVILFLPSILSTMVMALLYQTFVDTALVEIFDSVFKMEIPALVYESETRFWAIYIFHFITGFGTSVLMYTGAMNRIPESVVEAAELDGVGSVREFFSITLPLIAPTVVTLFLLDFTGIFMNQWDLYSFFGKTSDTLQTIGYYNFVLITDGGFSNYPLSGALGLMTTVIVVPISLLIRKLTDKIPNESF